MANADGSDLLRKVFAEGARVMAAVAVILTTLWMVGKPAALQFVGDVIDGRHLATQADVGMKASQSDVFILQRDVNVLDGRMDRTESLQQSAAVDSAAQAQQLDEIEGLLKEQRGDIKDLIRAVRAPQP